MKCRPFKVAAMRDVVVVCWPQERAEVERLSLLRIPRLLLVEPGCPPPVTEDVLEDWVRLPFDDRELKARLATLRRRAETLLDAPRLDRHGRLLFREHWVSVTPTEERLLARLAHHFNDVRVTMHRLRRRVRPMTLELRRMGDGWLLQERDETVWATPRPRPGAVAP
jgi:hypothetical protein